MIAGEAMTILESLLLLFAAETAHTDSFARQTECMAQNVWFEARGSTFADKLAVAQVVMNRVRDDAHAATPCEVIWEDYQFSWTVDGLSDTVRIRNAVDQRAWVDSVIAALMAIGGSVPDLTSGATHFHAVTVSPDWSHKMQSIATYGGHVYYAAQREAMIEPAAAPAGNDPRAEIAAMSGLSTFWETIGVVDKTRERAENALSGVPSTFR